jgi:hypothetical protein
MIMTMEKEYLMCMIGMDENEEKEENQLRMMEI